jgi:hypothetical protein
MSSEEDRSPGGLAPAQDLLQRGDGRPVYRVGFASSREPLALDPLSPITPPVPARTMSDETVVGRRALRFAPLALDPLSPITAGTRADHE